MFFIILILPLFIALYSHRSLLSALVWLFRLFTLFITFTGPSLLFLVCFSLLYRPVPLICLTFFPLIFEELLHFMFTLDLQKSLISLKNFVQYTSFVQTIYYFRFRLIDTHFLASKFPTTTRFPGSLGGFAVPRLGSPPLTSRNRIRRRESLVPIFANNNRTRRISRRGACDRIRKRTISRENWRPDQKCITSTGTARTGSAEDHWACRAIIRTTTDGALVQAATRVVNPWTKSSEPTGGKWEVNELGGGALGKIGIG